MHKDIRERKELLKSRFFILIEMSTEYNKIEHKQYLFLIIIK